MEAHSSTGYHFLVSSAEIPQVGLTLWQVLGIQTGSKFPPRVLTVTVTSMNRCSQHAISITTLPLICLQQATDTESRDALPARNTVLYKRDRDVVRQAVRLTTSACTTSVQAPLDAPGV